MIDYLTIRINSKGSINAIIEVLGILVMGLNFRLYIEHSYVNVQEDLKAD
jgi:hypothetical protein